MDHTASDQGKRLRSDVVHTLQVDALTAEVVGWMAAAGIPTVVLKGATLADLWRPEVRTYGDVDVLIDPARADDAARVLREYGFVDFHDGMAADERPPHADLWTRAGSPGIDVHRSLPEVPASPVDVWAAVSRHTATYVIAGRQVVGLDDAARALVLGLHAAQSGTGALRAMHDLGRGLDSFDLRVWQAARQLAEELDAITPFAAGLRLADRGVLLADELGLPAVFDGNVRLRTSGASSASKGIAELVSRPGLGARARYAMRRLFPTAALIRQTEPVAGRAGVIAGYVAHLVRVLWRAPGAVRDYVRAR